MNVIKKSGRKEEFSLEKLKHSLQAANAFTDEPLNINAVVQDFHQIVSGKDLITTHQIDIVVFGLLYAKNAVKTLLSYHSYDKK